MDKDTGADRSQLVAELTQIEELARQLEAHLDQPNSMIEFCKAAAPKLLSSIKRSICMARSTDSDGGQRRPNSGSDSPRSASGSPRGENSGPACKDHERKEMTKKRKTLPKWTSQVSVCPGAGGVEGPLDDGYSWRKYGQKDILGAKYPRGYYRCTHRNTRGCLATKQVQRSDENAFVFDVTYHGHHTCLRWAQPGPKPEAQDCDRRQSPSPRPGLKAKAQGLDSEAQDPSSLSFFSWTPVDGISCDRPSFSSPSVTLENGYVGSLSPTFRSAATSESNYLAVSPCRMGSYGGGFSIRTPESDLTEIISAATSATNSPLVDMDFMLEPLELDPSFPFNASSFFS